MRVVVTGASGQVGAYLVQPLGRTGWTILPWTGSRRGSWGDSPLIPVDLTDEAAITRALDEADPDVVLHIAAISAADQVRRDPARGRVVNVDATRRIARWCADHDRRLVFASTDMVFDGERSWYRETDEPRPILAYGATKRDAELEALKAPNAVVARLCLLYGPTRCDRPTFFDRSIAGLRAGKPQTFFYDEHRAPLDFQTAAEILVELVRSPHRGILHVGGPERLSRFELMSRIGLALGFDPALVHADSRAALVFEEPRPADLSLNTSLLAKLLPGVERPGVEEAVRRMYAGATAL